MAKTTSFPTYPEEVWKRNFLQSKYPNPSFLKGNYEINWISAAVIILPSIAAVIGFFTTPLTLPTFLFMLFYYYLTGIGITAGYHRFWSHRSFDATPPLEWLLAVLGAASYQGSAKWWCRNHRIHHRYIDTNQDPYNAKRGFFYTHIGWMLMKQDYKALGHVDVSDLKASKIVEFQHRFYLPIAFTAGVVFPVLVAWLCWGDFWGGFFYCAMARICLVHHSTFFVNSLAHHPFFGSQTFSDHNTSQDSVVTAVLTLGEGYHNFHHQFPNDYRNGVRIWHYDPTKWTIRFFSVIGWAKNLIRFPGLEIRRNAIEMRIKKLEKKLNNIDENTPSPNALPSWTWQQIKEKCSAGEKLIVIRGFVVDCLKPITIGGSLTHSDASVVWYRTHPGGKKMLDAFVGKDATTAFEGEVYAHSSAAANLMQRIRVARVEGYDETLDKMSRWGSGTERFE